MKYDVSQYEFRWIFLNEKHTFEIYTNIYDAVIKVELNICRSNGSCTLYIIDTFKNM